MDIKTMLSLETSYKLLTIIARSLGYDYLSLRSGPAPYEMCDALFNYYGSYDTFIVKADGKKVKLKYLDDTNRLIANDIMYDTLVRLLYKTLDNGGFVSDGRSKVTAGMVPQFMIGCVLSGC